MSKMLQKYDKTEILGRGRFGTVYRMVLKSEFSLNENDHPSVVAVKEIPLEPNIKSEKYMGRLEREIFILTETNHENIVRYFTFCKDKFSIYLILEYCNGTLKQLIEETDWTGELRQVQPLCKQIACGFLYLHYKKIIHRDVKPENILVKFPNNVIRPLLAIKDITVKISDFGLSRIINSEGSRTLSIVGNGIYISPEMAKTVSESRRFKPKGRLALASDVFSVGALFFRYMLKIMFGPDARTVWWHLDVLVVKMATLILLRLRYGKTPLTRKQMLNEEEITHRTWIEEKASGYSSFKDLVGRMLKYQPEERMTMKEVVDHPALDFIKC